LRNAGEFGGVLQQPLINIQCRSHAYKYAQFICICQTYMEPQMNTDKHG